MTTTQPHTDPALELFLEWRKARAAASTASDALAEHAENQPQSHLFASEDAALAVENSIIDRLMDTQAQTPAGALAKALVLANLAGQSDDPLVAQFSSSIQPELERILADLIGTAQLTTS